MQKSAERLPAENAQSDWPWSQTAPASYTPERQAAPHRSAAGSRHRSNPSHSVLPLRSHLQRDRFAAHKRCRERSGNGAPVIRDGDRVYPGNIVLLKDRLPDNVLNLVEVYLVLVHSDDTLIFCAVYQISEKLRLPSQECMTYVLDGGISIEDLLEVSTIIEGQIAGLGVYQQGHILFHIAAPPKRQAPYCGPRWA